MDSSKSKQPWTVPGVPWKTESAFWVWVRGILRKGWSRHPVKLEYIKNNRKQIPNPNPKGKKPFVWGMTCQQCKKDVVQSDIEIDHIGDNASFTGLSDVEGYVKHLFLVDFSSLESCCKPCHSIRSHAQNKHISFEEARFEKLLIEKTRQKAAMQVAQLKELGYNDISNPEKRKAAWIEILKKETNSVREYSRNKSTYV